jgi:SAM-dependent methyltransferase
VLEPSDDAPDPAHLLVTADGVDVDPATLGAASRHVARYGLDALDLVPADLPAERMLELMWMTDPATFRETPLARGRGALSALLLTSQLAERLGIAETTEVAGLSPLEMLRLTAKAKRYAPLTTDLAVAPGLRAAADEDIAGRFARLESSFSVAAPMVVGLQAASLGVLAKGASSRRPAALAAVAAHALTPWIATQGTPLAPRDLPTRVPNRLLGGVVDLVRTMRHRHARAAAQAEASGLDVQRAEYDRMLAGGLDALFEPHRTTCPICGSDRLALALETPELNQGKPGAFRLDECWSCGHVFQNPALTDAGLDLYYRDFYDGAGEEHTELIFGAGVPSYQGRADLVGTVTEPRRWLDVGAGHGHFCLLARTVWPHATFDGLDMSGSIDEAERRGWVHRARRGSFTDMVGELAGSYDVVSMHHYLEHTRDPGAELDAATKVLEPGGHLLIELPDASSWLGRRLGRYWAPWLQPQHLHFLTADRVETMLRDRGFEVLATQRTEPHQPAELLLALYLAINDVVPPVDVPWRPPSTPAERWRRDLVLAAAAPFFVAGVMVDALMAPAVRRTGASNSFRILARAPG